MAQTPSTMLPLGTELPDFSLADVVSGSTFSAADFEGPGLLVVFTCNHCPFVRHIRRELGRFGRDYQERGLAIVAIASNDVQQYPQDGPDGMLEEAREGGYTFPYLFDETQAVARAFRAACTPDFFLFDGERRLAYRGQFDDSRPSNQVPVTGADLRKAADLILAGERPGADQVPSVGCNIKWKPGNAPAHPG